MGWTRVGTDLCDGNGQVGVVGKFRSLKNIPSGGWCNIIHQISVWLNGGIDKPNACGYSRRLMLGGLHGRSVRRLVILEQCRQWKRRCIRRQSRWLTCAIFTKLSCLNGYRRLTRPVPGGNIPYLEVYQDTLVHFLTTNDPKKRTIVHAEYIFSTKELFVFYYSTTF